MHIVTFPGVNLTRANEYISEIVHHGGAGTTHATARAGTPQVIIPHNYDQFYWAHRVQELGAGVSGPLRDHITADNMAQVMREALQPQVKTHAQEVTGRRRYMGRTSPGASARDIISFHCPHLKAI